MSLNGDKTNDLMATMTRFFFFFSKSTDDVVSAPYPMCVWIPYVSMEMISDMESWQNMNNGFM